MRTAGAQHHCGYRRYVCNPVRDVKWLIYGSGMYEPLFKGEGVVRVGTSYSMYTRSMHSMLGVNTEMLNLVEFNKQMHNTKKSR